MSKRRQIITAGGPKLQAPALPVEVTSGKLGPGAIYNSYQGYSELASGSASATTDAIGDSGVDVNLGTGKRGQLITAIDSASTSTYTTSGDVTIITTASDIDNNCGLLLAALTGTGSWQIDGFTYGVVARRVSAPY